jgi:hypothetical protein
LTCSIHTGGYAKEEAIYMGGEHMNDVAPPTNKDFSENWAAWIALQANIRGIHGQKFSG